MDEKISYVTAIKRSNKPESNEITEVLCDKKWVNRVTLVAWIMSTGMGVSERKYFTKSPNGDTAEIEVIIVNQKPYLTTKANDVPEDNLGELPELD